MDIPKEAIAEFQALYLEEYGISLSFERAREYAHKLLGLYRTVTSSDEECRD